MATYARCKECGDRGVVSMDQPPRPHGLMQPTTPGYIHHTCADTFTPGYVTRLDLLPNPDQSEWRIRNFQNGIESARLRLAEIDTEITPLLEERTALEQDIQRWENTITELVGMDRE